MRRRRFSGLCFGLLCGLLLAPAAWPDNISPLLVELRELQSGIFSVRRQTPAVLPRFYQPEVRMPDGCDRSSTSASAGGDQTSELYQCAQGLRGKTLSIVYPGPNPSVPSALRIRFADGTQLTTLLRPEESSWEIPQAETWSGVARDYSVLGMGHIVQSMDHLLFVVCLLWIAGSIRRILATITGFTLAHSVTLGLSALDVIRIPVAPVEASIALSILFLAGEVARGPRDTMSWRYPIVISSAFGLLHGLGFASALAKIGLPQTELVAGLLFFNVGVELGQIAFILFVLALGRSFRLMEIRWPEPVVRMPVYFVGVLSAWWTMRGIAAVFVGNV